MSQIDDIKASFTEDQQKVYDMMFADPKKLKAELIMCRRMYKNVLKTVNAKDIGPLVRLYLMNISAYWDKRCKAMEELIERTENKPMVEGWKEEADAKSQG